MKPASLLVIACLLLGCVMPGSRRSDPRDFAVTTCATNPNEIQLAQKRARSYLSGIPVPRATWDFLRWKPTTYFQVKFPISGSN